MTAVCIIGGGPAGFMAAATAKENNPALDITIFDSNEPLKTILYTGNGRCNITNAIFNAKDLAVNYPRGEKFLYSIFSRFGVTETVEWFQGHDLKLYTQPDNRMFPVSDDANEVRQIFLALAQKLGIKVLGHTAVESVSEEGGKFKITTSSKSYIFDNVVIATGGRNKAEKSGFKFAESLGQKITDLKPALSALVLKDKRYAVLSGVALKDIRLSFSVQGKRKFVDGDFLFTHKGISGPVVYKVSSICAYHEYSHQNPLVIHVDFVPSFSMEELEKDLIAELDVNSKKNISNIIKKYIPVSLAEKLLTINALDFEKKASQISKNDRKIILRMLKETELAAVSTLPDGEIVTAGGVNLKEINAKRMESKIVPGLHFCGEVLDIDGFTGGFNLQACWSTGYIVGISL